MSIYPNVSVSPQGPAACRYIPAYLAIDIEKSSLIAMSNDAGP